MIFLKSTFCDSVALTDGLFADIKSLGDPLFPEDLRGGQASSPSYWKKLESGANTAAIESYNKDNCTSIEIRQNKYLNNIVEQDHRFIKKKVRSTLGFKKFHAAHATIAGVESFRMIKKGQLRPEYSKNRNAVEQFYSLAA